MIINPIHSNEGINEIRLLTGNPLKGLELVKPILMNFSTHHLINEHSCESFLKQIDSLHYESIPTVKKSNLFHFFHVQPTKNAVILLDLSFGGKEDTNFWSLSTRALFSPYKEDHLVFISPVVVEPTEKYQKEEIYLDINLDNSTYYLNSLESPHFLQEIVWPALLLH